MPCIHKTDPHATHEVSIRILILQIKKLILEEVSVPAWGFFYRADIRYLHFQPLSLHFS